MAVVVGGVKRHIAGRRLAMGVVVATMVMIVGVVPAGAVVRSAGMGRLVLVPHVDTVDCGHGAYLLDVTSRVTGQLQSDPSSSSPLVVQQQQLDLVDPSGTRDSGALRVTGRALSFAGLTAVPGHAYRVRTRAAYGDVGSHEPWGPWSSTSDLLAPGDPPTSVSVSSLDYPLSLGGEFGEPQGRPSAGTDPAPSMGTVTVTVPRGAAGFQYAWNGFLPISRCEAGTFSSADSGQVYPAHARVVLPVPGELSGGLHVLTLRAIDRADQVSEPTTYRITVAPYRSGATPGSDRTEAETAPVTTRAVTYVHREPVSSGHAERTVVATGPGVSVALMVAAPVDGLYGLQLAGTRTDHSATVQVLVDGVTQLDPNTGEPMSVDLYAPTSTYTEAYVASARLTAGQHTITFVTTASNPSSRSVRDHGVFDHGSSIGIDFLRLTWTSP